MLFMSIQVEANTILGAVQMSMQVKQIAVKAIIILGTVQTMNMHHNWQILQLLV